MLNGINDPTGNVILYGILNDNSFIIEEDIKEKITIKTTIVSVMMDQTWILMIVVFNEY